MSRIDFGPVHFQLVPKNLFHLADVVERCSISIFDRDQAIFDPAAQDGLDGLGHTRRGFAGAEDEDSGKLRQVEGLAFTFKLNLSFEHTMLLAATVYHAGVVTSQVGNVLACRSDRTRSSSLGWLSNKYLWIGILIELLGIAGIIYVPFLAKLFNHVALPAWLWIGVGMNALVLYSIEWIRKTIVRGIRNMRNGKTSTLALQEVNR